MVECSFYMSHSYVRKCIWGLRSQASAIGTDVRWFLGRVFLLYGSLLCMWVEPEEALSIRPDVRWLHGRVFLLYGSLLCMWVEPG